MTKRICISKSIVAAAVFLGGCGSSSTRATRAPSNTQIAEVRIPNRDELMGSNRAQSSVNALLQTEYPFRNVISAFPDPGKNMLIKEKALPKNSIRGAVDNSPLHLKLYQDQKRVQENKARFSNSNIKAYSTPLSQREAALLAQSPKLQSSETFDQMTTLGHDDVFEPNNTIESAFNLSNFEERWLALAAGPDSASEGVQWDEDWYKIYVSSQYRHLMLDLRFQHYLGDVDLSLYDSKGQVIASSQSSADDEFIFVTLDRGGTYFVRISGANRGNRYDFKYSTLFAGDGDDEYEENDSLKTAFDLRSYENQWLSEIEGEAVAADNDFYLIKVPTGKERVQIDLRVDVNRGDVDVRLLDSSGKLVASSAHIGDDDYIDFTVPSPGSYYIKVYPFSAPSGFNLYDLKWMVSKPSIKMPRKAPKNEQSSRATDSRFEKDFAATTARSS